MCIPQIVYNGVDAIAPEDPLAAGPEANFDEGTIDDISATAPTNEDQAPEEEPASAEVASGLTASLTDVSSRIFFRFR